LLRASSSIVNAEEQQQQPDNENWLLADADAMMMMIPHDLKADFLLLQQWLQEQATLSRIEEEPVRSQVKKKKQRNQQTSSSSSSSGPRRIQLLR
jgi:hypothetical protein